MDLLQSVRKDNTVTSRIILLHANRRADDFEDMTIDNYQLNKSYAFGWPEFYLKEDLEKDGYIHADNSLKFEFYVKKKNHEKILK